jgi:hypothetical protein
MSRPSEPVDTTWMPSSISASPIFMMEPLPNCFSICCSAAASAFALLSSMVYLVKFERIMAQGPGMEQKLLRTEIGKVLSPKPEQRIQCTDFKHSIWNRPGWQADSHRIQAIPRVDRKGPNPSMRSVAGAASDI